MLEKIRALIPDGEESLRLSYERLEKVMGLPKSEIRTKLRELVKAQKITIVGGCIFLSSAPVNRCAVPEHIKRQVFDKFESRCAYCGCRLASDIQTIDHIFPLAEGGLNKITNFFPACIGCNRLKGSLDLKEFKDKLCVDMFYFECLINTRLY